MIRAIATLANGKKLAIFGIDKGNVKRLQKGQPIKVDLEQMGIEGVEVLICYRDTLRQLQEDLAEFIGPRTVTHADPSLEGILDGEPEEE